MVSIEKFESILSSLEASAFCVGNDFEDIIMTVWGYRTMLHRNPQRLLNSLPDLIDFLKKTSEKNDCSKEFSPIIESIKSFMNTSSAESTNCKTLSIEQFESLYLGNTLDIIGQELYDFFFDVNLNFFSHEFEFEIRETIKDADLVIKVVFKTNNNMVIEKYSINAMDLDKDTELSASPEMLACVDNHMHKYLKNK